MEKSILSRTSRITKNFFDFGEIFLKNFAKQICWKNFKHAGIVEANLHL